MNNHRLYFNLIFLLIIIYLTSSYECDEHYKQDNIPFDIKVQQSPFILIGISLKKNIDIDIPNLFNVTFLVQCILKGRPTSRIIHIVQAGSLLGRRSCQKLDINREYIVFLETFYDDTYRPVDFEEIPYNNQINVLLGQTCGLSRTYPYIESNDTDAISTIKCPSTISMNCPLDTTKTTVETSTTTTTTMSSVMLAKSTIDLALLTLLLAEHQHQNLSLDFLQGQNHKSLFSDDNTRKNQANQLSYMIIFSLIQFIFCSIFYRFL